MFTSFSKVAFAIGLCLLVPLASAVEGFSISGGTVQNNATPLVVGYEFAVASQVSVTHLGWLPVGTTSVPFTSAEVGLWNSSGTLLASTTVNTSSTLSASGFRYNAITALDLGPGSYRIAGLTRMYKSSATAITPNVNGLTFTKAYSANSSTLVRPTSGATGNHFWGPNLQVNAVPEPGTVVASVVAGVMFLRRRRKA
jgi:hypothetical protein